MDLSGFHWTATIFWFISPPLTFKFIDLTKSLGYSTERLQWEEQDATERSVVVIIVKHLRVGPRRSDQFHLVPGIERQNHCCTGAVAVMFILGLPGADLQLAVLQQLGPGVVRTVAKRCEGELERPLQRSSEDA